MSILGLDIGGANIKAADITGKSVTRPFAIWRHRERLKDAITSMLAEFPQTDQIALTMTAELADCFSTKSEGVQFIVDAVEASAQESFPGGTNSAVALKTAKANVLIWTTDGHFITSRQAREAVRKVAAANWHALATWCGTLAPGGPALLLDIGTTTTDIIPMVDGRPTPVGLTDVARLQSGELTYSGIRRTPLCAVAHSVPFHDGYCALAAELFATTLDAHLLLDHLPEDAHDLETADGRPATKAAACDRIARMVCCDRDEVTLEEAVQIAKFLADVQRQRLAGSLERVAQRLPGPCQSVIVSGSGHFLVDQLVRENRHTRQSAMISLADCLSPGVAEAACAYALARLASNAADRRSD